MRRRKEDPVESVLGQEPITPIELVIDDDLIKEFKERSQEKVMLLIDGSPASGKTTLAHVLMETLSQLNVQGLPISHLKSDFWVHPRVFRNSLELIDPEKWRKFESWYRFDRLKEFLDDYLFASSFGVGDLDVSGVYRNGFDGLFPETVPVTQWSLLEGVFSASENNLEIIARYDVTPVVMVIDDVSLEERIERVRKRAPFWGQDPDEQERRMEEVFEPSWQDRRQQVLGLAQWRVVVSDRQSLTIVKNSDYREGQFS